jgi:hypothetical protein
LGNAKSFDVNRTEHTNLEGTVCTTIKERRHVPYIRDGEHSYKMTFSNIDANQGKCCVSKSRMREIRLSGSVGGLPMCNNLGTEGGLP